MKKLIPVILFPYLMALDITLLMATGYISEMPVPAAIAIYIFSAALNVTETVMAIIGEAGNAREILTQKNYSLSVKQISNVKLIQIPAYLYIFVTGFLLLILPMGFLVTVMCWLADVVSICFTGLLMTFALAGARRQNACSTAFTVVNSILSFIFCVDVFDSIYLRNELK